MMTTTPPKNPQPVQVKIELDAETAQGMYINMAMVNHNESEFTLDFIYVQPQEPKGKVRARVISSPKHTKRLLLALQDAIAGYERKFGTIDVSGTPVPSGQLIN
jgi:hypothetical protein